MDTKKLLFVYWTESAMSTNGDVTEATALWKAANRGYVNIVRALLNAGANINMQTLQGSTPLVAAISSSHSNVAWILLDGGCDVNKWCKNETDEMTAVHFAALKGDTDMVKRLIELGNFDENIKAMWQGVRGYNLLHFACRYDHQQLTNFLVNETRIDINAKTSKGVCCVEMAEDNKNLLIVECLMNSDRFKPDQLANIPSYLDGNCKSEKWCVAVMPWVNRHGFQPAEQYDLSEHSIYDSDMENEADNIEPIWTLKRSNSVTSICSNETVSSVATIDSTYPTNGPRLGVAVIITNRNFSETSGLTSRMGSTNDKDRLRKSLMTLELDVHCYEDLSANEMRECMKYYSSCDYRKFSCFVCCISSHGGNNFVYGTDGTPVRINDLTFMFTAGNAKHLSGKPKIFIIAACQALEKASYSDVVRKEEIISRNDVIPVTEEDFLVCFSTLPGQTSYRDVTDGTVFIKTLTKNLDKYGKSRDIDDIMRNTTKHLRQIKIKTPYGERKQVCLIVSTLQHRFVLSGSFRNTNNSLYRNRTVTRWKRLDKKSKDKISTNIIEIPHVEFIGPTWWKRGYPLVYV